MNYEKPLIFFTFTIPIMPKKQVYLLYNSESDKDNMVAKNLSVFFSVFNGIQLKDTLGGQSVEDIKKIISESDMIIPLISIDFLSSETNIDLTEDAFEAGKHVSPILSRACPWQMNPALKSLESELLPRDKPLFENDDKSMDKAFTDLVKHLAEKIMGEPISKKLVGDTFFKYLSIGASVLAIVALYWIYTEFLQGVDLNGNYTVIIALVLIALIIIAIPVLQIFKPSIISSLLKNNS